MPVYEYWCSRCKNVFELHPKMDEGCKALCPKCMAPAQKLISASHFVLKGSGFYVNDYPSRSPCPRPKGRGLAPSKYRNKKPEGGNRT